MDPIARRGVDTQEPVAAEPEQGREAEPSGLAAPGLHTGAMQRKIAARRGRRSEGGAPIQAAGRSEGATPMTAPVAQGTGSALPSGVRKKMEGSLGADFSDVRVHQGSEAKQVGAVAYTQGNNIHFQPGRYDPASQSGQELLGHELTHVVQQRSGQVVPQGKDSPINADPSLEAQADEMGKKAARGEPAGAATAAGTGASHMAAPIQRYKEVDGGGDKPWRLSDNHNMLVGLPENRSKNFFAKAASIEAANAALATAGSYITLANTGEEKTVKVPDEKSEGDKDSKGTNVSLNRVKPVIADLAPKDGEHGKMREKKGGGGGITLPADCNDAARVIMGIVQSDEKSTEESVTNKAGGGDQSFGRDKFSLTQTMKQSSLVERGGLTALLAKMEEYKAIVAARSKEPSVAFFLGKMGSLSKDKHGDVWKLLHDLQTEHAAFYKEFTTWAGIDEQAMPKVGDALVTYRAEGKTPDKIATAKRLHDALVVVLTGIVTNNAEVKEKGDEKEEEKAKLKARNQGRVDAAALLGRLRVKGAATLYADLVAMVDEMSVLLSSPVAAGTMSQKEAVAEYMQLDDKKLWNKHWGGVVMTDGGDYTTLENDASTKDKGQLNDAWGFGLYGSRKEGQSFHSQMMATGDFGNFASTMRFRKPEAKEELSAPKDKSSSSSKVTSTATPTKTGGTESSVKGSDSKEPKIDSAVTEARSLAASLYRVACSFDPPTKENKADAERAVAAFNSHAVRCQNVLEPSVVKEYSAFVEGFVKKLMALG